MVSSLKFGRMVAVATVIICVLVLVSSSPVHAWKKSKVKIAPIGTKPGGQTYGRWAAEWWQWVLGIPAAANPLFDTTGENCAQRQVDDVWFLAGNNSNDPVTRNCTVPKGKALFFPLINNFYGAFLNDPPETRTEEFVRGSAECSVPVDLFVEIDGVEVKRHLLRFFTGDWRFQSPLFNVQLPPGNIFGVGPDIIPELALSPSAEEGYYLYVKPLRPGEHILRWLATGCTPDNTQDITYILTITDGDENGD